MQSPTGRLTNRSATRHHQPLRYPAAIVAGIESHLARIRITEHPSAWFLKFIEIEIHGVGTLAPWWQDGYLINPIWLPKRLVAGMTL